MCECIHHKLHLFDTKKEQEVETGTWLDLVEEAWALPDERMAVTGTVTEVVRLEGEIAHSLSLSYLKNVGRGC